MINDQNPMTELQNRLDAAKAKLAGLVEKSDEAQFRAEVKLKRLREHMDSHPIDRDTFDRVVAVIAGEEATISQCTKDMVEVAAELNAIWSSISTLN